MKNKTLIIIMASIVIIIVVVVVYAFYMGHQKRIGACQSLCNFYPTSKAWTYSFHQSASGEFIPSKSFQTQEQCINYCLTQ